MAKYKIAVFYVGCNSEEIIEIEEESLSKAEKKCEQIKTDNLIYVKNLKSCNIYTNRIIKECKVYKADWKQDLLRCLNFLEKKEE